MECCNNPPQIAVDASEIVANRLTLPLTVTDAAGLSCSDYVKLSGELFTARDAAHKLMIQLLGEGKPLPFDICGAAIYYVGPTPAKPDQVIGSAGPTTSYRMDAYTPALLKLGLRAMIGKGGRSDEVTTAIKDASAVYFAAIGGAGALLSEHIRKCEVIAFPELGAEAVHRLEVVDFPVIVAIDTQGRNIYHTGPECYNAARVK